MRRVFRLGVRAVRRSVGDHVTNLAQAVAFNTFLSIPAALLVALGVFATVADAGTVHSLLSHLNGMVPASVIHLVEQSLDQVARSRQGGVIMIAVGLLLALWSLLGAMRTLIWAMNTAYDRTETRGFLKVQLVALALLGCLALTITVLVGVAVLGAPLGRRAFEAVGLSATDGRIAWVVEVPVAVAVLLAMFGSILYLGPSLEQRRFRLVTPGAVVATAVWLVSSFGFGWFVGKFGSYNKTWGSLSAVIVMLTWLWLSSMALLVGAEIDAEVERERDAGAQPPRAEA